MRWTGLLLCCVFATLTACEGTSTAALDVPDATTRVDRTPPREPSATGDMDDDGLCDLTEQERRTDPLSPDTDGDGLLDSFEVRVGSDPLGVRDPLTSDRVLFTDGDATVATLEHLMEYEGVGEVLGAALQDRAAGLDGRRASELVDFAVEATTANPAAFVRALTGSRFVGVVGRVVLQWRVTARPRGVGFDAGVGAALGCRRAYEALLLIKREGDDVVSSRRLFVEFTPPRGSTARPSWPRVSADGLCLPERCF